MVELRRGNRCASDGLLKKAEPGWKKGAAKENTQVVVCEVGGVVVFVEVGGAVMCRLPRHMVCEVGGVCLLPDIVWCLWKCEVGGAVRCGAGV